MTERDEPAWLDRRAFVVGGIAAAVQIGAMGIAMTRAEAEVVTDRASAPTTTTTSPPPPPSPPPTTVAAPPAPPRPRPVRMVSPWTPVASPMGEIPAYDAPGGTPIGRAGFWYGYPMTMPILQEVDGWMQVRMPERPNGHTAWVESNRVTRGTTPWHMVVELSLTRVYVFRDGQEMWSAPLGIGTSRTRTPTGNYFVAIVSHDVPGGYGPIVLDLSAHSEDIQSWKGSGDAITSFHGPFGSQGILRAGGGRVSNGCLRMLTEDQLRLDGIPVGTPVDIYG